MRTLHVALTVALAPAVAAQALRVPGQFPTITAALAAAQPGDTILVAPGTYAERLVWPNVDGIRLIGEQGAANTILDGTQGGRVVDFPHLLSPATEIRGFTITNGLLTAAFSDGAGIRVTGSAPTIRQNRITGNVCAGATANYGGGIAVTGIDAHPKILHNEIDGNELRDGAFNHGAGVSVDGAGAATYLAGNRIHDNRITTVGPGTHHGRGAGIYVRGTNCTISANVIAANSSATNGSNFGGGVMVDAGSNVRLPDNTIADNLLGGSSRRGGGAYFDGPFIAMIFGSIVASNSDEGIYRAPGSPGYLTSHYDNVWNNPGGNFVNVPGAFATLSVDPQFVGSGDYHLRAASPCIDARHVFEALSPGAMDIDMDPLLLDGDLGGGPNAARHDIGADEYSGSRLAFAGVPTIGATFAWVVTTAQPASYLLALSLGTDNVPIGSFGYLLLDAAAVIAGAGTSPAAVPLTVPNAPGLRGVDLHAQALALFSNGAGQLTNLSSVTVF